jgi:hypothetical protein
MNLILFEWKLIVRNKRLKQQLMLMLWIVAVIYIQFKNSNLLKETFLIKELLLWATFVMSANFATWAFNINAAFIEKQIIAPMSVFKILQAKYRLFCIIASVLFIVFLPSMSLGIKLMELVAAFLFAVGFGFFGLFLTSLFSYKPFDIKASTFFNYQGVNIGNYFFPILVMIVDFCFIILLYNLFNEIITLIVMSLVGLVFIVANSVWLKKISESFEKTKYYRLERFREK